VHGSLIVDRRTGSRGRGPAGLGTKSRSHAVVNRVGVALIDAAACLLAAGDAAVYGPVPYWGDAMCSRSITQGRSANVIAS
jgi:hypothetical protein